MSRTQAIILLSEAAFLDHKLWPHKQAWLPKFSFFIKRSRTIDPCWATRIDIIAGTPRRSACANSHLLGCRVCWASRLLSAVLITENVFSLCVNPFLSIPRSNLKHASTQISILLRQTIPNDWPPYGREYRYARYPSTSHLVPDIFYVMPKTT